jgi:hypothetical protein
LSRGEVLDDDCGMLRPGGRVGPDPKEPLRGAPQSGAPPDVDRAKALDGKPTASGRGESSGDKDARQPLRRRKPNPPPSKGPPVVGRNSGEAVDSPQTPVVGRNSGEAVDSPQTPVVGRNSAGAVDSPQTPVVGRPSDVPQGSIEGFGPKGPPKPGKRKLTKLLHDLSRHGEQLSQLEKDITANKNLATEYTRKALQTAGETLRVADDALAAQINRQPSEFAGTEIQRAIATIARSPWASLLEELGLADNETARSVAQRLSNAIAEMTPADVPGSWNKLQADIKALREIVGVALQDIPSPGFVHQLIDVTYTFGLNVAIGSAAAAASAEAVGGSLAIDVVSGGIAAVTTASLTRLYRRASREFRARSLPLKRYHHELMAAALKCYITCRGLAGSDPPRQDEIEAARRVLLATEFMIGYVEQLDIALPGLERKTYREILVGIRNKLNHARAHLVGMNADSLASDAQSFSEAHSSLDGFTPTIDGL